MGWPGPMTHPQFEAWQAWLDEVQFEHPSMTDLHLMRVAQRVEQVLMTEGRDQVTLRHEQVRPDDWKPRKREPELADVERESEMLKRVWGAYLNAWGPSKKNKKR
jgi:hypothetical protein